MKRIAKDIDGRIAVNASAVFGYHLVDIPQEDGTVKYGVDAMLPGMAILVFASEDAFQAKVEFERLKKAL